jgi:hypothetical protein
MAALSASALPYVDTKQSNRRLAPDPSNLKNNNKYTLSRRGRSRGYIAYRTLLPRVVSTLHATVRPTLLLHPTKYEYYVYV